MTTPTWRRSRGPRHEPATNAKRSARRSRTGRVSGFRAALQGGRAGCSRRRGGPSRRPRRTAAAGQLWEFPGGQRRIDAGPGSSGRNSTSTKAAFRRSPSRLTDDFHLPLYVCRKWRGRVNGRAAGRVGEAGAPRRLPPADRPLVAMLRDNAALPELRPSLFPAVPPRILSAACRATQTGLPPPTS